MESLDAYFPYPEHRPYQREMLGAAALAARRGGICMIDAPTGSGKSSVVSALLAERGNRKVIVGVRTISQLTTFIRELSLIRLKKPNLRFSYLIGKKSMCLLPGEGDVYRKCIGVKAFTTSLMRQQAEKGSLVPADDAVIRQQIRRMDRDRPIICPYYIQSRVFHESDKGGVKMLPSPVLRTKSEKVATSVVWPDQIRQTSGGVCPYEMMLHAAQGADVLIVNYHHIFNDGIRDQLYESLGIVPEEVLLLLDEAHNCGDVMQGIQSVILEESALEHAARELASLRKSIKGTDAVRELLPRVSSFMQGLKNSCEAEDWFDPDIFDRMVVKGSLYKDIDEIVEELFRISEYIREKNMKAGEFRPTAVERLTEFFHRLSQSSSDPAFLTVYRKDREEIYLEVRNIDPAGKLQDLATSHYSTILISGTLSPVNSYRKYYFEDIPVTCCSLPNAFPRHNRLVLCANDVTTAFSMRQNRENTKKICRYIEIFSHMKGNLAVYFPSYQILESYSGLLLHSLKSRNIFVEPRDPRDADDALKSFLSLPGTGKSGMIFAVCGGKWSEGLDYRGELLSGAMVIGLPLAPYNRVRQMTIDYFSHKFGNEGEFLSYTLPAVNRAQQALGRVLRSPDDRGILVLCEKRFAEKRVKAALPGWMQDEVTECSLHSFSEAIQTWS